MGGVSRTRWCAASLTWVAAAVAWLVGVVVPVSAREGAPVAGVLVERVFTAVVSVPLDGGPASVSEPEGFERRVDPSGTTMSEGPVPVSSGPPGRVGVFGCAPVGDGTRGFRDHTAKGPVRIDTEFGSGGGAESVFHVFSLLGARRSADGGSTVQVLVCAAGGAQPGEDARLLQAGVGVAYDDRDETFVLGRRWLVGATPPRGEDGYAFGSSEEAGATGFIEQEPEGEVEGSLVGPFPSGFDDYFRNAAAGWWEHPCLDGPACGPADGAAVFHGNLVGGLWEWIRPPSEARFRVAVFVAVACSDPLSCP